MKWPQSYTAEGFGAIGCRPGQRGPRGSNLSHAQPTPCRTARTPAGPGAQRRRRPTTLQLRWELVGDSITNDWGVSRVAFTLTNRGAKPLAPTGWAIYF